jgi:hypothetical protein
MFSYDEAFTNSIFEYCRDRLEHDAPLDFGMHSPVPLPSLEGMISDEGRPAQQVLEFFRDELAQHVVSIDSPRFLAFIPNAPTKNSLLFDMVVACSGLNGTSWLESAWNSWPSERECPADRAACSSRGVPAATSRR